MHIPPSILENLAKAAREMRGPAGVAWLKQLPALIQEMEMVWSLTAGAPFPGIRADRVASSTLADGAPGVLKLSFPEDKEFLTEVEALRLFDGCGVCWLLRLDREHGAMLLERCEPGAPLASVEDDEEATSIAVRVLLRMWRPVPPRHGFPLVSDWARGFERLRIRYDGGTGPMPIDLVVRAESLFSELTASQAEPRLLHGDFHHDIVLSSGRGGWLAIDPKGVVGEPTHDAATFLKRASGSRARSTRRRDPRTLAKAAVRGTGSGPRTSSRVGCGAVGAGRILEPGGWPRGLGRWAYVRSASL